MSDQTHPYFFALCFVLLHTAAHIERDRQLAMSRQDSAEEGGLMASRARQA